MFLTSKISISSKYIRFEGNNGAWMQLEFTTFIPRVEMLKPLLGDSRSVIYIDGTLTNCYITYGKSDAAYFEFEKQVSDAFWVIRRDIERDSEPQADARFEQIANNYQALNPKPELSEELHKYMVQAGAALREKDFDDSADLFREVARLAEWYPDAHFNLALSLAERGEFADAVRHMKRIRSSCPMLPMRAPRRTRSTSGNARSDNLIVLL